MRGIYIGLVLFVVTSLGVSGQSTIRTFQTLEAGPLAGISISVNNLAFSPGFFVEGGMGVQLNPTFGVSLGTGYQQFRDIRGIPLLANLYVSPNAKRPGRTSYFLTSMGYTVAWNPFLFQEDEKLRGGFGGQIGWGTRVFTGEKSALSIFIGYRTQQTDLVFTDPNENQLRESLFYHFLTLRLGVYFGKHPSWKSSK